MKMDIDNLGERIQIIFDAKKIKQRDVVSKGIIQQSAFAKIASGRQKINQDFLESMQSVTDVNLHWLLTGKGEMISFD